MEIFTSVPSGYRITSQNDDVIDPSDEIADIKGRILTDWREKEKALRVISKGLGLPQVMGLRIDQIHYYAQTLDRLESSLKDRDFRFAQRELASVKQYSQFFPLLQEPLRKAQDRIIKGFLAEAKNVLTTTDSWSSIVQLLDIAPEIPDIQSAGLASAKDLASYE